MSTLKINRTQFGQSNTATNNFTLTAEAADGTLKLARGNAGATTQDVITVASDGKVNFPAGLATAYMPIGVSQTWQNLTASRALSTTYTNSTGRPILVEVVSSGGATANLTPTVGGVNLNQIGITLGSGSAILTRSFIVPAGDTYSVAGSGLLQWNELR